MSISSVSWDHRSHEPNTYRRVPTVIEISRLSSGMSYEEHNTLTQARTWEGNCTCYHTEMETVDKTCYVTNAQHTDSRPTSPSIDPATLAMSLLTYSILTAGRPVTLAMPLTHRILAAGRPVLILTLNTCYVTNAQHTDSRPTSPSVGPVPPDVRQGSHKRTVSRSVVWLHQEMRGEMAATKPRRREMAATQQRRREMAATKPNRRRVQHGVYQHFSEKENSADLPSMYQVVCSASVCQLSSL